MRVLSAFARWVLVLWLACGCACAGAASLMVIVNSASSVDNMSRQEVSHLFLGRIKHLPTGVPAVVIDTVTLRDAFYNALVGQGIAEIDAYWARLRFSGRTQPPLRLEDSAAVIERVARERGAIGYIDATQVDRRVKVVLRLDY